MANVIQNVVAQSNITSFSGTVAEFKKELTVIYKVGAKNVSDKAQHFRVEMFFLEEGKTAGVLVLVKEKRLVLKLGWQEAATYSVLKAKQLPKRWKYL